MFFVVVFKFFLVFFFFLSNDYDKEFGMHHLLHNVKTWSMTSDVSAALLHVLHQ